jgi:hypothetical protein
MTTALRARPTTYNGIEMRSRFEARVAAFLDDLGIEWEYELRAFASGRKQYLPDFYLGLDVLDRPVFLEVRGFVEDPDIIEGQLLTIRASEPTAMLIWADEDQLSRGWMRVAREGQERFIRDLVAYLPFWLGLPQCDHYRLPEYRS